MKKLMKLLTLVVFTLGLFNAQVAQAATLDEIKEKGQLVVGMNAEYPPFEWVEMVDGKDQVVGIDAELAQLIADAIGVELVIDNRAFDSLIPTLNTNKIDLIISGMSNTEERAKQVDFSVSYYDPVSIFAVRTEDADTFTQLGDFNNAKVGALMTSTQEHYLKQDMPDVNLVSMGKNGDLIEGLVAKKVDAIFMSDLTLEQYLTTYSDRVSLVEGIEINNELLGTSVAMSKGNTELLEVVNKVIEDAKADGTLEQIFADSIAKAGQTE
ncbi:transporter substrate-binding domain-containing protein [Suicoccus acidiformans]|nr:transporter substrate-binding domain-containing protein [Suicoccus acidiformans]